MKKLTAIILVLVLALGCAALADEVAMPEAAGDFEGVWQCDRATVAVYWEEEGFKVQITWGSSAWEHTEWQYSCYYHGEDNTLVAVPFGICKEYVYGEDGELVSATEVYNDGEAVFSLDAEGYLIWQDLKENAGEGMRFEKLPEVPAVFSFATIGEAMASEGYTGIAQSDYDHYVVAVKLDDSYIRLVADMDGKARELFDATLNYADINELEAADAAYRAYIKTLPVSYEEEITAKPMTQEELDALAGKTLLEVEEAGFEHNATAIGENDVAIYTVSSGLFNYDLLLDVTFDEYLEQDDNGFTGDLKVKSAGLAGLSRNAADLRYHADGTVDEEPDAWAEFNRIMDLVNSAMTGENPEEAIRELQETMPDHAEDIRMLVDVFSSMSEQAGE